MKDINKELIQDPATPLFNFQFSPASGYDKYHPDPSHFKITNNSLEVNLYKNDVSFLGGWLYPRSELRSMRPEILYNVDYTFMFDHYIKNYPQGFDFCFAQVFAGSNPDIIIRYKNGNYQILNDPSSANHTTDIPNISIMDSIGVWVNWIIKFKLSTTKGYIKLYRNGFLIGSVEGLTVKSDTPAPGTYTYIKHGIYAQEQCPPDTMTTYTRNMYLYKNNPGIKEL
jgi:hypothetical protein